MISKFESRSARVKGLAFHPQRPWLLTSLHNGSVCLYDYRYGVLLDRFEDHEGPVRGVGFHHVQPLIVSGGDDYKVKVWDYKLRRCLYTLLGHLDYIRTCQFHPQDYPWIVSASDDQTIRIWNWMSRTCISVLTGHNHYVMCANFHPKEDLIVSASLDQTVRVWDTTGLRRKTVRGAPSMTDDTIASRVNNDLFGGTDAVVKYVLEGHDRGVNWASFHPNLPLLASGADDRQVKMWRMNDSKAWEVDTLRGHTNNVSCVIFHPKHDLIISNSEDRTVRVWDMGKRLCVRTLRRETDRFWILAAHPTQNLLAAGHDGGMMVFKLERERPPFDTAAANLFYVRDRYLRVYEFGSGRDVPIMSLRRAQSTTGVGNNHRALHFNQFNPNASDQQVLVTSDVDDGTYELCSFSLGDVGGRNSSGGGSGGSGSGGDGANTKRGSGTHAVFIARNRFAVFDKSRGILIKDMSNTLLKKITVPVQVDGIFSAGVSGRLMLRCEDRLLLYDYQARKMLAELPAHRVKFVVWSVDSRHVAFICKHAVIIATRELEHCCTITETVRVKSGAWDIGKRPMFIYCTLSHVKYVLPNGDTGIVRGLDQPVYIARVTKEQLFCLDRERRLRTLSIDTTEALFKLALEQKDFAQVMHMVKHSRLCGEAIVAYLQEKGYPEVALHFVQDSSTRFKLALACGDLEVAIKVAYDMQGDECWLRLASEALRQGQQGVVEMCYQKVKNFDRLSFLYLLMGNTDKLRKMLKIAEMREDVMSRFHNALYLGDASERVRILQAAGQDTLAYLTAATHGLSEDAERLRETLEKAELSVPAVPEQARLLQPPTPILRAENWPLLKVPKTGITAAAAHVDKSRSGAAAAVTVDDDGDAFGDGDGGAWGDDDLGLDEDETGGGGKAGDDLGTGGAVGGGWGDDDDLDLGDDDEGVGGSAAAGGSAGGAGGETGDGFTAPAPGTPASSYFCENSSHAADHIAAGSVESAMQLLNRQIAATSFAPLHDHFVAAFTGSHASLPGLPLAPSVHMTLRRNPGTPIKEALPVPVSQIPPLLERLKTAYRAFTAGKFAEARQHFDHIIHAIVLTPTSTRSESNELRELLEICREYITALRIKEALGEESDVARQIELSAYFTHCNLQPMHLLRVVKLAMTTAFKAKNFITAAGFARRLLELPDIAAEKSADMRTTAQKVLNRSEAQGRNEHTVDYDERNPFDVDCSALRPIYRGSPSVRCPYCASVYGPEAQNSVCVTCGISQVGVETVGLVTNSGPSTGRR